MSTRETAHDFFLITSGSIMIGVQTDWILGLAAWLLATGVHNDSRDN